MRKETIIPVILSSLGIVCLLALAAFITIYHQYEGSDSSVQAAVESEITDTLSIKSGEIVTTTPTIPKFGDEDYQEPEHSIIFVGDSRTVGMGEAVQKYNNEDNCQFIAKSGEGFDWLCHDGIAKLEEALAAEPNAIVVFNMGVNDLKSINQYLSFYEDLFSTYKDPSFFIMSVNPVVDEKCSGASNQEIEDFNQALQESFPDKYINCYDYLLSDEFETVDGLHYPNSIYRKIHHFAIIMIQEQMK